jgi:hypothetical protein
MTVNALIFLTTFFIVRHCTHNCYCTLSLIAES